MQVETMSRKHQDNFPEDTLYGKRDPDLLKTFQRNIDIISGEIMLEPQQKVQTNGSKKNKKEKSTNNTTINKNILKIRDTNRKPYSEPQIMDKEEEKTSIIVKRKNIPHIMDIITIKPSKHKNDNKLLLIKNLIKKEFTSDPDPWINARTREIYSQDEWDETATTLTTLQDKTLTKIQQNEEKENKNPSRGHERKAAERAKERNKRLCDSENNDDEGEKRNKPKMSLSSRAAKRPRILLGASYRSQRVLKTRST